jgi:GT2 family glycosyltransferase
VLPASIIVPTYNRPAALERTLGALRAMDVPAADFEIVVVDGGDEENRSEQLAAAAGALYRRCPDAGVAVARNRGASVASGELLLFVDDDIVVGSANLRQHEAVHLAHDRCLVSGHWEFDPDLRRKLQQSPLGRFRLAYEDLYNKPDGVEGDNRSGQVHPQSLAASNLSVRADLFRSLGGFDERFPVGAEDRDLSWRAARAGCLLVYDFDIRVIHNDQHADLEALCRRMERGAIGTVYFTRKNPDAPRAEMLALNGRVAHGDSLPAMARKLSRSALSTAPALALAHALVRLVERMRPDGGWPLEFLYRAVGGLHVFRGVRRGSRLTAGDTWAPAHETR